MKVMTDELFGPIMCIKTYQHINDTISYINARPRPLALYYFSHDKAEETKVLQKTISGGVTVNDVMQHVGCEDLPFGGTGDSGMGHYHGIEGFKTFSHSKSVFTQAKLNLMKLGGMVPPYGAKTEKQLARMLKK
jgi:coniferyl-aldehyde dehydrogenase